MDAQNLTLPLAFLAGLLSFVSPCVLPLVPAYVGYLGGTAVMGLGATGRQQRTGGAFFHSLFFVLGFGLVFVLLGASATFVGRLLLNYSLLLQRVGGVLLVVFGMRLMGISWSKERWLVAAVVTGLATFVFDSGLAIQGPGNLGSFTIVWLEESVMMGLVVLAGAGWSTTQVGILAVAPGLLNFLASPDDPVSSLAASVLIALAIVLLNRADFFYSEKKIEVGQANQTGFLRSWLFGVVFAAGWTPCVGPILAAILLVASRLQTVGQGMLLLTAYTLGLGVPFLLVGLAFGPLSKLLRKMTRYLGIVSVVSGVLLVLMGILIFTNSLAFLAQFGNFFQLEL
jgi:cytochrome c-type biogenesis protein